MKKALTILILFIATASISQSFQKLQLTGLKNAEILKTDEKGNVVSSEICQAKIRGIDTLNSAISVYPLKNVEFYGKTRTELSAIFLTYSPDVEKAEDLKITLNLKKTSKTTLLSYEENTDNFY